MGRKVLGCHPLSTALNGGVWRKESERCDRCSGGGGGDWAGVTGGSGGDRAGVTGANWGGVSHLWAADLKSVRPKERASE